MPFHFGGFELDEEDRRLSRSGKPLEIGDRAFDLLATLAKTPGRLLAKDVLMDAVWPNLFVTENNLQVQVSGLRRILGAEAIATVPGRGYRFTLPVQAGEAAAPLVAGAAVGSRQDSGPAPLVGRGEDLAAVRDLLAKGGLVTVTGAGGIGKTSLARILAQERRAEGRNLLWLDLAPVREPGLLNGMLAESAGLAAASDAGLDEVAAALRGRATLVVIDNAEHLTEAVAALAAGLLEGAPDAALLVTSQAPLRLSAEQVYRLDGLDLPQPDAGVEAVLGSGAGALFVARARALDRHFALTGDNALAVAGICRRLDGSPLALELAAARLSLFGPKDLERRLDKRFEILTRGFATAPDRQQTLQAVLEWSHGLLAEGERVLFRRLGVFSGAFPLAWACQVGGVDGAPDWAVMDALGALLDRSLVEPADAEGGSHRLTETARAFALARLVEAQDHAALASGVGLYESAGEAAAPRDAVGAYSTALDLQRRLGEPRRILAILLKLGPAVQTAISPADPRCGEIYAEAVDLARAGDDPMAAFHALWGRWHYLCMSGQLRAAAPLADELARLAPQLGDDGLELEAWHAAFTTQQLLGDAAAVVEASRRARALYDPHRHCRLGERFGGHDAGICALGQGAVGLWLSGFPQEALADAGAAVAAADASADIYSRAVGLFYAAITYQGLGRAAEFARCAEGLKALSEAHGMMVLGWEGELLAGRAAVQAGRPAEGLPAMTRAFAEITGSGDTGFGMYYASLIAEALLQAGDRVAAAALIGRAMAFAADGQGFFLPELHRLRAAAGSSDPAADLRQAVGVARRQHAQALADRAEADLARLLA